MLLHQTAADHRQKFGNMKHIPTVSKNSQALFWKLFQKSSLLTSTLLFSLDLQPKSVDKDLNTSDNHYYLTTNCTSKYSTFKDNNMYVTYDALKTFI